MPSDSKLHFDFKRKQFPVRPIFAMTINRSQGQTLQYVGLYLPDPVFSHGQLYVAFSLVSGFDKITVYLPEDAIKIDGSFCTRNEVYHDSLV
jgi:hypothetical protein